MDKVVPNFRTRVAFSDCVATIFQTRANFYDWIPYETAISNIWRVLNPPDLLQIPALKSVVKEPSKDQLRGSPRPSLRGADDPGALGGAGVK